MGGASNCRYYAHRRAAEDQEAEAGPVEFSYANWPTERHKVRLYSFEDGFQGKWKMWTQIVVENDLRRIGTLRWLTHGSMARCRYAISHCYKLTSQNKVLLRCFTNLPLLASLAAPMTGCLNMSSFVCLIVLPSTEYFARVRPSVPYSDGCTGFPSVCCPSSSLRAMNGIPKLYIDHCAIRRKAMLMLQLAFGCVFIRCCSLRELLSNFLHLL